MVQASLSRLQHRASNLEVPLAGGGRLSACNLNSVYHQPVFHLDAYVRPTDVIADELLIKSANSKKGTKLECCFCSLIIHMCKNFASPNRQSCHNVGLHNDGALILHPLRFILVGIFVLCISIPRMTT
jgi:hypothetical protein